MEKNDPILEARQMALWNSSTSSSKNHFCPGNPSYLNVRQKEEKNEVAYEESVWSEMLKSLLISFTCRLYLPLSLTMPEHLIVDILSLKFGTYLI